MLMTDILGLSREMACTLGEANERKRSLKKSRKKKNTYKRSKLRTPNHAKPNLSQAGRDSNEKWRTKKEKLNKAHIVAVLHYGSL